MELITYDAIAAAVGVILSLVVSWAPKINTWYAAKPENIKKVYMAGILLLSVLVTYGLGCAGYLEVLFGVSLACTSAALIGLVKAWFIAITFNQSTFLITPQTKAVKVAKAEARIAEVRDDYPNAL